MNPTYPPTLTFVINQLDGGYQNHVWESFVNAAAQVGVGWLCFPSKVIDSPFVFDQGHNIIFNAIRSGRPAGILLCTAALTGYVDSQKFEGIVNQLAATPIVSFGVPLSGRTSVLLDNERGIAAVVAHLAESHGCRRIGYLSGITGHWESEERLRGFKQALQDRGLEFRESQVIPGWFVYTRARDAVLELIRGGRFDFDSLVCASDEMALGACDALRVSGFKVPEQVRVVGFDDVAQGASAVVPLTTMRVPFHTLLERAVSSLLWEIENFPARAQSLSVVPQLVVRDSCGAHAQLPTTESGGEKSKPEAPWGKAGDGRPNSILGSHEKTFLRSILDHLLDCTDLGQFRAILERELAPLGLSTYFVSLYERPVEYVGLFEFQALPPSRLLAAVESGRPIPFAEGETFSTGELVPPSLFDLWGPHGRRFIVLPLFLQNTHYGVITIEYTVESELLYEDIRNLVSTGLSVFRSKESLRTREREFKTLAENSPDGIVRYDSHGHVTYVNPAYELLRGVQALERQIEEHVKQVQQTGKESQFDLSERSDGGLIHLSLRAVPEFDSALGVTSVLVIVHNITKLREQNSRLLEISEERRMAEIRALEAQVNPHFFYNTLNALHWLAVGNNQLEIGRGLRDLAAITRYSISQFEVTATLEDEVQWIRQYLDLQQLRFGKSFHYSIQTAQADLSFRLYKLLFQPLLENAVIHGFESLDDQGSLEISFELVAPGILETTIRDNGKGIDLGAAPKTGGNASVGLVNLRQRLRAYYGDAAKLELSSTPGKGTTVRIVVPEVAQSE